MSNVKGKWDDAQATEVANLYDGGNGKSVAEIAEATGRTPRSVQGKLTSLGLYIKPEKAAAKPKDDGPTKSDILAGIVSTGMDTEGADGATKGFLSRVESDRRELVAFREAANG